MTFYDKSFDISFIMLSSISIITLFRSTNNLPNDKIKQLQLSSLVTIIASMHYYMMMNEYNTDKIVSYRYYDWFFTTPLLLYDLCLILDIYDNKFYLELLGLNTLMLSLGYIGEIKNKLVISMVLGFIPLIVMFYRIIKKFNNKNLDKKEKKNKEILLYTFLGFWSLYGVSHIINNFQVKNIILNILDIITKGFFGLYIYKNSFN